MSDEPVIAPSARKHRVDEADVRHAYRNPMRVWDLGDGLTMVVGAGETGVLYEVGYVQGEEAVVIVHAMPARAKFLR